LGLRYLTSVQCRKIIFRKVKLQVRASISNQGVIRGLPLVAEVVATEVGEPLEDAFGRLPVDPVLHCTGNKSVPIAAQFTGFATVQRHAEFARLIRRIARYCSRNLDHLLPEENRATTVLQYGFQLRVQVSDRYLQVPSIDIFGKCAGEEWAGAVKGKNVNQGADVSWPKPLDKTLRPV
jgi:hypothetical protein